MNRFIGPTGYYFGTKPDRRLRKEKLIRQLRQRFPHLSVFPHPAYWEPWLSPKHGSAHYQQSPYFSPGLAFPYVTLRGEAAHKATHVRHPLGVFQLRPWRFQSPLFNLPVNRKIRQGRFHNVFYKKTSSHSHSDTGRKPPKLFTSLPSNKIADAIAHRQDERNNRLKSHLWSKALPASKNKERLAAQSKKELEKIETLKKEKSSRKGKSPLLKDDNSEDDGSEYRKATNTVRSSPSSKLSRIASKTKQAKSSPLVRSVAGSQLRKTRKSLQQTESPSEWGNSPTRDESDKVSSAATNSRKEREALEAIARRKKYEKQQLKQALRAEQDKRKAEEDYLKRLMVKAIKKPKASGSGVILHRTRSQKRRALYRKYRNKETLLPDEQMQLKKDREKSQQLKFSHRGKRLYPYGNFPPKFQKTPAADSRFYWGPDGPDLRNESNKDKPNIFHRPSEQVLSGLREDDVASTVFQSEHSSDTPGKKAAPGKNKQPSGKRQIISTALLNVHAGKEAPKKGYKAESHSSSPSRNTKRDNAAPIAFSLARTSKYGSSTKDRHKEISSEPGNQSHSDLTSATVENLHHKRRKKQKIRCAPKEDPKDSILEELNRENLTVEVPETFVEAREKLMKLRQKAWQQSLRRAERKKAERMERMKADMAERETRLQKVVHPEIEKADMKRTSHLSIPSLPAKHSDKDKDSSRGKASHSTLSGPKEKEIPKETKQETIKEEPSKEIGGIVFFPEAKNRREAFRAYVAKNLLRLKAQLIFGHRVSYQQRADPKLDRWGRPVRTEIPLFDNKNPYLVGVIKTLMRSKIGFRYKWESRAEEFMNNFPFVEFQTYKKYPVTHMTKHDRIKHYMRLKKLYRGQTLFKMATPLRWYKSIKKNSLEAPFDFELHSDAVEKFQRLLTLQNKRENDSEEPGGTFHQFGLYNIVCSHLKVAPFRPFQEQLAQVVAGSSASIDVSKQNLTDEQVRPIAMCIMLSELVNSLDISGNLISPTGAQYIAGICGHTGHLAELNASDQHFGPNAVEILYQCLKRPYCKMQELHLNNCGIGSECAQLVASIIRENRSLVVFDIGSNNLANVGHNDMFGLAIAENPLIRELNLSQNGFGEKASFLIFTGAKANSSLEIFRFDNNHVGEEGCKAIAGTIEQSDRLRELYLEHCAINDVGAKKIGSGIEKSTAGTLEKLVLRNNPMGGDGASFILKAASSKDKLRHVDLSLCPVHTKFVDAARKMIADRTEVFVDHTGDNLMKASLPKYQIDMEALAENKAKAEAAKKKNKK